MSCVFFEILISKAVSRAIVDTQLLIRVIILLLRIAKTEK